MRVEAWIFGIVGIFFLIVSPVYWLLSKDPTGTAALIMTTLLAALVAFYLGVVAKQIPDRPEDLQRAEIADGAGEQGFFPPYSWWPLFCALSAVTCILGIIFGWWLFIIGIGLGSITLCGWVFEFYRGVHAH